jgi:hypothetical protein
MKKPFKGWMMGAYKRRVPLNNSDIWLERRGSGLNKRGKKGFARMAMAWRTLSFGAVAAHTGRRLLSLNMAPNSLQSIIRLRFYIRERALSFCQF